LPCSTNLISQHFVNRPLDTSGLTDAVERMVIPIAS
jgi:hypothetical protein